MRVDRNGLEVLSPGECLSLLRTIPVGRVAFCSRFVPVIFPVNFVVVGGAVCFRTGTGSKLDEAVRRNVIAFQADGIDVEARGGWSVLVTGVATLVTDAAQLAELEESGLQSWVPSRRSHTVRLSEAAMSGRRLPHRDR